MAYVEFLRARGVVTWYVLTAVVIALFTVVVSLLTPHSTVVIDDKTVEGAAVHGPIAIRLIAFWAVAGFFAAIVSTIVGASLACENRGHLDLAWTKPVSRSRYALRTMAVDAGAILIAQIFTAALIAVVTAVELRGQVRFTVHPGDLIDYLRFALFPLAWYGLLQGLTAGLRGQAGIVQGLIWPISLGMAGAQAAAPLSAIWRDVVAAFNLFNPFSYLEFSDSIHTASSTTNVITGVAGIGAAGILGALALAMIGVLGTSVALIRWRRLEA